MMDMDDSGNIQPKPEQIAELQAKQDREEKEKRDYLAMVERTLRERGELWLIYRFLTIIQKLI